MNKVVPLNMVNENMNDIFFQILLALAGIVISIYAQTIRRKDQRRLLFIFGGLLILFAGLWAGSILGAKPASPISEPTLTEIPTLQATATSIPTPTDFLTATSTPASEFVGFDFESGTQGWGTSEGEYKLAEVSTTTDVFYTGNSALELNTELFGNGSTEFLARNSEDVYRHTEAVVYLNNNGPYDLTGKTFSCFVYLPNGLAVEGSPRTYIRLLAKDTKFANQFSQAVDITQSNIDQWIELSFVIDVSSDTDFDPKQTNALGIRLDSLDGSTVQYTGPIYIDNCSIK